MKNTKDKIKQITDRENKLAIYKVNKGFITVYNAQATYTNQEQDSDP